MGSCISKCRPKKKFKEDYDGPHVHDKLVISQDPLISSAPAKMTATPLQNPLSPPPSTSSFSSFSSSNSSKCSTMASSIASSSSSVSSVLSVKDKTFSNEFLWSCVKENPHAIGLKDNKILSYGLDPSMLLSSPNVAPKLKHSAQEKAKITPKKRARASSPTLVRQKSFRKEQNSFSLTPNRGLRSPSPSRRFIGENNRSFSTFENSYKRPVLSKGKSAASSATSGPRRESFRASIASPNRVLSINPDILGSKRDAFSQHISTKIDAQVGVGDTESMDVVMEDINNPLIALDCFIFL